MIQADYHNLIGITAELVDTLEATIQGQQVSHTNMVYKDVIWNDCIIQINYHQYRVNTTNSGPWQMLSL